MSSERAALGSRLRFSLAAAGTTWAATISWHGFTELPERFLWGLILIGSTVAVTGALGRWRRLHGAAIFLGQSLLGTAVACLYITGKPWPGGELWSSLDASVNAASTYAAPVPLTDSITVLPLLVVGGLVAMLVVDLCACTLGRVPLAGLPLLTIYSVPISVLNDGLSWWVFALTAGGFMMMLFLQEQAQLERWGRSLDGSGEPVTRLSDTVRASALGIAMIATAAAIVAPLAIPSLSLSVFDLDNGPGGDSEIKIVNPLADLRRDLVRGSDIDLVTVTTDDPSPDHLRISVLNRFTDNQFSSGDRDVPSANLAQGDLPSLEGVGSSVGRTDYQYDVDINDDFESRWLPTQAPISRIEAEGDWRFDVTTMDFLASDDDLTTAGMSYSMTAVELTYNEAFLLNNSVGASGLDPELTALPADLSPKIDGYVLDATAGTTTPFAQAVALQQWFRNDDRFTYSLGVADPQEIGADDLEAFLDPDTGRIGYCEQFAAAMAVMARSLDIPARVAVGFLSPDPVEDTDDTYVYSSHDLHAWPELYFPDAGWVLFDPTPSGRVAGSLLPDYTRADVGQIDLPSGGPGASETAEPSTSPAEPVPSRAPQTPVDDTAANDAASDDGGLSWIGVLGGVGGVVLLIVVVGLPRWLRARQRARRLAGGAEAAWEELCATTVDLGLVWPEARSPRETQDRLVQHFGTLGNEFERPAHGPSFAPDAVQALGRIVLQLEQVRYARQYTVVPGGLHDDVLACCEALAAGATQRVLRRATWLPRSVTQRRAELEHLGSDLEPDLTGGVVEHL